VSGRPGERSHALEPAEGWPPLPGDVRAEAGEVHVVFAELAVGEGDLALLGEDERVRAGRFLVEPPRREYVACRATLRRLLGRFAGIEAAAVRFGYGAHGKPFLEGRDGPRFNVAHSGGAALYAFALGREVGVDVEPLARQADALAIARSVFSKGELAELAALPPERVAERFLTFWTRKEAYAKALGLGLSLPFTRVDVASGQAVPEPGVDVGAATGTMVDLRPEGYVGALAAEGGGWRVRRWTWSG
jgi:4'-phosphopantetheinyl transferase